MGSTGRIRRAINFDLHGKSLEEHYSETNPKGAYQDIRRFFENNEFEHRQGSGYRSTSDMTDADALDVMRSKNKSDGKWVYTRYHNNRHFYVK